MKLAVFSHKLCQRASQSPTGFVTDGGFPLQMEAISELFTHTRIVVPCGTDNVTTGQSPLVGNNLEIVPLTVPGGTGALRKLRLPIWFARNSWTLVREAYMADAIHAPVPGDIGTFGLILALLMRKPLFVRHCGNWMVQRTTAERFWKWCMERFAGGRNVMLATGGGSATPSEKNKSVKWIYSTSLHSAKNFHPVPRQLPLNGHLRLIIACRQEERKGTDIVIESLPLILRAFPEATLDVVGGGSLLPKLERLSASLGVSDRVTFHGKVSQSRVSELLRPADIFCYPTSASEGFPKVVIEALACGLPVITTKVSVLPHLVGASESGLILDEVSAPALAESVINICSDEAIYQRMSANAINTSAGYTLESWKRVIKDELCRSWGLDTLSADRA